MAAISLFWDTNMAAVTSCQNTLYDFFAAKLKLLQISPISFFVCVLVACIFNKDNKLFLVY